MEPTTAMTTPPSSPKTEDLDPSGLHNGAENQVHAAAPPATSPPSVARNEHVYHTDVNMEDAVPSLPNPAPPRMENEVTVDGEIFVVQRKDALKHLWTHYKAIVASTLFNKGKISNEVAEMVGMSLRNVQ